MKIQITEEEVLAEIRRTNPYYDSAPEAWQKKMEQYARESLIRHRRYMLLEANILLFFQTEGLYEYDPEGRITSGELYGIYKQWCLDQQIPLHPPREFWLHARKHAAQYRLVYSTYIPDRNGKRCRGFYGIRPLQEKGKKHHPESGRDGADGTDNSVFRTN